jgi:hypothetical protein
MISLPAYKIRIILSVEMQHNKATLCASIGNIMLRICPSV